jgi:hypothetical protein
MYLLVAMCVPFAACTTHEVNTWERWCEQIRGVDLERKYRGWGIIFGVSYDAEAIRKDFAERFNAIAIASVSNRYFDGRPADDPVLAEMARLRLIGAWHESTELHWAHSYLSLEYADPVLAFSEVTSELESKLERYRNIDTPRAQDGDTNANLCIWGTIDGVYKRLVLHGPDERVAEIELQHTLTVR